MHVQEEIDVDPHRETAGDIDLRETWHRDPDLRCNDHQR